jgi:hypothetical protein
MTGVAKVYFGLGAFGAIFVYWGAFSIANGALIASAVAALAYAVAYLLAARPRGYATQLDYAIGVFFLAGLVVGLIDVDFARRTILYGLFSPMLYGFLCIVAWAPLLAGAEPFTVAYAKRTTPKESQDHLLFVRITRLLAAFWGLLFLISAIVSVPQTFVRAGLIPMLLMIGIGIPFTAWFPRYYVKRQTG